MHQLEVFFDYLCPFCLRAHNYLKQLIAQYPQIEIVWRPCEAHPRSERSALSGNPGIHSDLMMQGMYYALEKGADLWAYNDVMFQAVFSDRADIGNIDVLAGRAGHLLNEDAFRAALQSGKYAQTQLDGNQYAYQQNSVSVVPSYRMDGKKLDSIEGIGVSGQQLADFMASAKDA